MVWSPIGLLPEHRETAASLWRQLLGGSYVWWALAVILAVGLVSTSKPRSPAAVAAVASSR
jgi:alpha-1,2-mannosyltransferase